MACELSGVGTAPEVIALLDQANARDEQAEKVKKSWGCAMGFAGLALFVSFFLLAVFWPVGLVLALASVIVLIIGGVRYSRASRLDFEDRKIASARAFFAVMAQDIPRKGKCKVVVQDGNMQRVDRKRAGAKYVDKLQGPWFLAQGELHDGNSFRVEVERFEWRKYKVKSKGTRLKGTRVREEVGLVLRVDPQSYPDLSRLPGLQGTTTQEGLVLRQVRLVQGEKPGLVAAAVLPDSVTHHHLLGLLAHVYGALAQPAAS